jgi:hypothetical protein
MGTVIIETMIKDDWQEIAHFLDWFNINDQLDPVLKVGSNSLINPNLSIYLVVTGFFLRRDSIGSN